MSMLLMIPILAVAGYLMYRHLKGELAGDGACCGCSKQSACRKRSCAESLTFLQ